MVYLDYAANYPTKKEVLDELVYAETNFIGNYNSTHKLGKKTFDKYLEYNEKIMDILGLDPNMHEIIYTSSATESNNLAIKGIIESYSGTGKKILVSEFEHNSINAALGYIKSSGYDVEFIASNINGVDIDDLRSKMSNSVVLVICSAVDGETGLINNIDAINEVVGEYKNAHLLIDATQAIGKINVNLNLFEMISFTPHKFGGLTGTGLLVKKKSTILTPLFHGGLSNSLYRSGSVPLGLIASIYKSLEIAYNNMANNYIYCKEINKYLLDRLKEIDGLKINSFNNPYIVNISISNIKSKDIVEYLSQNDICVSQKSACSIKNTPSKSINVLYKDKKRALESFRISLSDLTTKDEIDELINTIKRYINNGKI